MNKVRQVILGDGSRARHWLPSRSGFPKQFLCLTGKESLFHDAAKRLLDLSSECVNGCAPFVIANEEHRFLGLEQLREITVELSVALLEPVSAYGRSSA